MTTSKRTTVIASSLGSLFGIGFNTPEQQMDYFMGRDEPFFSELSKERMALGNAFEEAMLDYWEERLGIVIHTRNTKTVDVFDGKLRVKVDGITTYNGEKTLVEAKYSLADSGSFISNRGYMMQCMAGMEAHGCTQALLLGLYKGEPHMVVIPYDKEIVQDIEEMVTIVWAILNGMIEEEGNYPYHLVDKYTGNTVDPDQVVEYDESDNDMVEEYLEIKEEIKDLQKKEKAIKNYMSGKYPYTEHHAETFKVAITDRSRKGGIDYDKLISDHPEINLEAYRKADSTYKVVDIRRKKVK